MVLWREFVAHIGKAEDTGRRARDERQQESAAVPSKAGGSNEEVVGVGGSTQRELGP